MKGHSMERFIQDISQHLILYDPNHPQYKDSEAKNEVWEVLAATYGTDVKSVKTRWRGLKDTYSRHLKVVSGVYKKNSKAGSCRNWVWARHMSFLRPYMGQQKEVVSFAPLRSSRGRFLGNTRVKTADTTSGASGATRAPTDEPSSSCEPQNVDHSAVDETLPTGVEYANEPVPEASSLDKFIGFLENGKEMDAVDYLFLSWAKTVKQFSPRRLITVKKKISDLIMDMEQDQLEEDDTLHYTSAIVGPGDPNQDCNASIASSWSSRTPTPEREPMAIDNRPRNEPIIKSESNSFYQNGIR